MVNYLGQVDEAGLKKLEEGSRKARYIECGIFDKAKKAWFNGRGNILVVSNENKVYGGRWRG